MRPQLKPPFTKEQASEMQKKALETRKARMLERKKMKEELKILLTLGLRRGDVMSANDFLDLEEAQKANITTQTAINLAMIKRAMLGDVQAATYVRDTIGEKPSDKIELDQSLTIEEWAKKHKVKL